jgi:hypothetical protein
MKMHGPGNIKNRTSIKFVIGDFYENLAIKSYLAKIGQKYQALCTKA